MLLFFIKEKMALTVLSIRKKVSNLLFYNFYASITP